ncbi:c-opsin [Caerostris extrusa]|uniref:C-opsin n=1 Tax=Caerostris extrusa TaxID=172846 RepID=A0AAV4WT88_CAEEX|nr:c-opsin [Caerostris extrusa]
MSNDSTTSSTIPLMNNNHMSNDSTTSVLLVNNNHMSNDSTTSLTVLLMNNNRMSNDSTTSLTILLRNNNHMLNESTTSLTALLSPKPSCRSTTAKAEHKVTVMASMMIVCTLAAWTPYAVVSLMVSLGYDHLLGPVSSVCPAIFAKTSVVYNPIVYFFFNTQIREAILAKMPTWKRPATPSGAEISLETKRGLTIVNTVISNHVLANCNETATTLDL